MTSSQRGLLRSSFWTTSPLLGTTSCAYYIDHMELTAAVFFFKKNEYQVRCRCRGKGS